MASELDAARIPWTFWSYNQPRLVPDPHKPPTGDNVNHEGLAVIDRPYPRVVAGIPEAWKWDADANTFTLRIIPGRGRISEIWTSPLHYPSGYAAKVTGARILSRRNAPVLQLKALRGADAIELELRRRR